MLALLMIVDPPNAFMGDRGHAISSPNIYIYIYIIPVVYICVSLA